MMNEKAEKFFEELEQAVESNTIVLPTLPEVAIKLREVVEDEDSSAQKVAETLTQDASLTARLIQVANSPLYRTRNPIEDLQSAVTRLGMTLVRDLVVSLAMKQIFQATSDALEEQFRRVWNSSVEVAAISRMLASGIPEVNSEQALLAGLVHNIGALPILVLAENDDVLFNDSKALAEMIYELQGPVGELILKAWEFPESMIEVVTNAQDFAYAHDGGIHLVDLIQVALLQGQHVDEHHMPEDWSVVPAFAQMSMDAEVNVIEVDENQAMINAAKQSLMA